MVISSLLNTHKIKSFQVLATILSCFSAVCAHSTELETLESITKDSLKVEKLCKDIPASDFEFLAKIHLCPNKEQTLNQNLNLKEEWLQYAVIELVKNYQGSEKNNLEKLINKNFLNTKLKTITDKKSKEDFLQELLKLTAKKDKEFSDELNQLLNQVSPRFNNKITQENIIDVAIDLSENKEHQKALELLKKAILNSSYNQETKLNAWRSSIAIKKTADGRREQLKVIEAYDQWLEKEMKTSKDLVDEYFDNKVNLSKALWNLSENTKAKNILEMALTQDAFKDSIKGHAILLLAQIYFDEKNNKKTLSILNDPLIEKIDNNLLVHQLNFFKGQVLFETEDYKEAALAFDKAIIGNISVIYREKALFWSGFSYYTAKKSEKAKEKLLQLSDIDPYGYYGQVAKYLLNNYSLPKFEKNSPHTKRLSEVKFLKELGLTLSIEKYLLSLYSRDSIDPLSLIANLQESNLYKEAFSFYFSLPETERMEMMSSYPQAAYPTPYFEQVKNFAQNASIPIGLVYSVIRQESQFDPFAQSPANARGLMQLLHTTAKYVAKVERTTKPHEIDELFRPLLNIEIGIAYLKRLHKYYSKDLIPTIASYNAGRTPVNSWLKKNKVGPIEFIESIPYKETRNYVIKVLRNFINYCAIYKWDDCPKSIDQFLK